MGTYVMHASLLLEREDPKEIRRTLKKCDHHQMALEWLREHAESMVEADQLDFKLLVEYDNLDLFWHYRIALVERGPGERSVYDEYRFGGRRFEAYVRKEPMRG